MAQKTLVIIPGWNGHRQTWANFVSFAEKKCPTICLELPCFGLTPCPATIWGVEEYADFVLKELEKISGEIILLGHSFGGQVACYLAYKHPEKITRLVLTGAAAIRQPLPVYKRGVLWLVKKIKKMNGEKFIRPLRPIVYRLLGATDYLYSSGIKREIFRRVTTQDLTVLLSQITTPTLILWGKKDNFVPIELGKRINQLIPNSQLIIYPKQKHGLHLTCPEQVLRDINKFY